MLMSMLVEIIQNVRVQKCQCIAHYSPHSRCGLSIRAVLALQTDDDDVDDDDDDDVDNDNDDDVSKTPLRGEGCSSWTCIT